MAQHWAANWYRHLALILITVGGTACGGSTTKNEVATSMVLLDGPVQGMQICRDANDNWACDANEISTVSGADGSYTLAAGTGTIIAVATATSLDLASGLPVRPPLILSAIPGETAGTISPYTTFARILMKQNSVNRVAAEESLRSAFLLSSPILGEYNAKSDRRAATLANFLGVSLNESLADAEPLLHGQRITDSLLGLFATKDDVNKTLADLLVIGTLTPPANSDPFANVLFEQGMDLAIGYDTLAFNVMSATQCLMPYEVAPSVARHEKEYVFQVINSKDDLKDLLNIGGSISLGMGSFDATIEGRYYKMMSTNTSSVFALIKLDYKLRDFRIAKAELTDNQAIRDMFEGNYENFRKKCGDRFVNVITTGGRYFGLLEIETKNAAEKEEITVKLSGTYKPINLKVDGDFNSLMESLASTYNTKITIASRGGVGTANLVTTLDEFKNDADAFVKSLDALDDPADYTKAAFLAKLEPYEQTTDLMVGGDVELQQDVLAEYIDLAEVYDTVQAEVELAKSHPEKYDHGESLLPTFTNKINAIKKNRTKLKSAAKACSRSNPNTRVCSLPEELNLADEEALRSDLPVEKEVYPKTCAERREAYSQSNTDRVYTLYLGADKNKPYLVYCQDQGISTATPQEYLELVNTSPKSDHPSFNYTKHINVMKSDLDQRTTMTSVFTKLKVLVNNDHLTILPGQTLYVESDGGPTKTGVGLNGYDLNQFATFGEPYVCDTTQATTAFNINLAGTPWKIAEGVKWVTPGKGVAYELEPKTLTWTDARANAMQKGGHLVTIDNAAENETIVAKFKSIANNSWIGFFIAKSVWSANDFRWESGLASTYANWNAGEPNNAGGAGVTESCGEILFSRINGTWNDVSCAALKPSIIEYSSITVIGNKLDGKETIIDAKTNPGDCGRIRTEADFMLSYVGMPTGS